jgi:hypothetical protein
MDLNGNDYLVELSIDTDDTLLLARAIVLDESSTRFYQDAAAKLPVREDVRIYTRMAAENVKRKSLVETLVLDL